MGGNVTAGKVCWFVLLVTAAVTGERVAEEDGSKKGTVSGTNRGSEAFSVSVSGPSFGSWC